MSNPWINIAEVVSTGEIDLREALHVFLFGDSTKGDLPHGSYYIIRRMRRNSDGSLIRCSCVDPVTLESPKSKNNQCRYCLGEGYLWDETIKTGYLYYEHPQHTDRKELPAGLVTSISPILFFEYEVEVDERDIIIVPKKELDGSLSSPISVDRRLKIDIVHQMRSDYGRLEYLRCRISEDFK